MENLKSKDRESNRKLSNTKTIMRLRDLPPDVITDIIARLPVKCLFCLRSVCKHWRSLIDSFSFIYLHVQKSIETKSHLIGINRKHSNLYYVDFDVLNGAVELTHPLMCYNNHLTILGTSNGLLCICNVAEDIAFWNPSIKKYKILPCVPNRKHDSNRYILGTRVYGFGYDAVDYDYKLVRISQFISLDYHSADSEVHIFSLKTNEWKRSADMPYVFSYIKKMGVFVSGFLHWIVTSKFEFDEAELIVGFDVWLESFLEVPMPECLNNQVQMELGVLEECLCLIPYYQDSSIEVWMMREYGIKESWTNLFSVAENQGVKPPNYIVPLSYSKNGTEILVEQDHGKLAWLDSKSQSLKDVNISGLPHNFDVVVCLTSLVPVSVIRRNDWKCHEPGKDEQEKRDDFLSKGFKLML